MKRLILLVTVALAGCGNSAPVPTYEQLAKYSLSCDQKHEQFYNLKRIQKIKNFSDNPDDLSFEDRKYNALLKEHLWWFVYNCEQ